MNEQFILDIASAVMEKIAKILGNSVDVQGSYRAEPESGGLVGQVDPQATEGRYSKKALGGKPVLTPVASKPEDMVSTWLGMATSYPEGAPARNHYNQRAMNVIRSGKLSKEQVMNAIKQFSPARAV